MKEEKNLFTKSYDATLLTFSILKRLGSGGVETFSQRLRSQKIQYFAQSFGVSPYYRFSLYLWGPYSPALANDLFVIKNHNIDAKVDKFLSEELEKRFNNLKNFIEGKDDKQLELVATAHWLIKKAGFSEEKAKEKLIKLKNATLKEIEYSFNSIKGL
jgi:uncharacterized protein YwgA